MSGFAEIVRILRGVECVAGRTDVRGRPAAAIDRGQEDVEDAGAVANLYPELIGRGSLIKPREFVTAVIRFEIALRRQGDEQRTPSDGLLDGLIKHMVALDALVSPDSSDAVSTDTLREREV